MEGEERRGEVVIAGLVFEWIGIVGWEMGDRLHEAMYFHLSMRANL